MIEVAIGEYGVTVETLATAVNQSSWDCKKPAISESKPKAESECCWSRQWRFVLYNAAVFVITCFRFRWYLQLPQLQSRRNHHRRLDFLLNAFFSTNVNYFVWKGITLYSWYDFCAIYSSVYYSVTYTEAVATEQREFSPITPTCTVHCSWSFTREKWQSLFRVRWPSHHCYDKRNSISCNIVNFHFQYH